MARESCQLPSTYVKFCRLLFPPFRAIPFIIYCDHTSSLLLPFLCPKKPSTRCTPFSYLYCKSSLGKSLEMGQDQQHLPGSEPVQEPAAMSGTAAGVAASCDYCSGLPAVVYCRADAARLCLLCDRQVHGANGVSSRHARAPLCATCCAAAAVFRRAARFLCSNCDFEENQNGPQDGVPLHDRSTVEGYTGCPSVVELTAVLGVCEAEKPPDDGWWSVWEEPQVLSWEDLIVPTTSCHDFHPLLTPSSPKIQRSPNGKMNEELLRQLGKLAMAESGVQTAAHEEAEQADDQLPSCAVPQYMVGHDNFGAENSHEAAAMVPPASQYGGWNAGDSHGPDDLCQVEFAYEQVPVSSAEACLSSFVEISEICPSMSHGSSIENSQQANTALGMPMQGLPKKGGYDIACPDRDSVISRYKEKRKTRRFDKQIRYESRKVRADSRLRIKGRFAKANQI